MYKWLLLLALSSTTWAKTHDVFVGNNFFNPSTLNIQVGDSVRFYKTGSGLHNVVADDNSFRCAQGCDGDGNGGNGDASTAQWEFTLTFNTPGLIGYYCEVHGGIGTGMSGNIRVMDGPLDFFFVADTAQEIPPPTGTSEFTQGAGAMRWNPEMEVLSWQFYHEGLTGAPTGAHVHGPTNMGSTAGVLLNLGDASTSPVSSSGAFTETNVNHMRNGLTYINLHTAANAPGEIRGQIYPMAENYTWETIMDTHQVTNALAGDTSQSTGQAVVTFDATTRTLRWEVTYSGLTSSITSGHIHAPARTGVTGPAAITIANNGQPSPISSGAIYNTTLGNLAYIDAELSYINIHTQTNPEGEIRGQLRPIIFKGGFD